MRKDTTSFKNKKNAFVDKRRSKSNAWRKKLEGKKRRKKKLKTDFAIKSKSKRQKKKRSSRKKLNKNRLHRTPKCTMTLHHTTCLRLFLRTLSVQKIKNCTNSSFQS